MNDKNLRRIVSLLGAALLLAGSCTASFADDISGHWASESLNYVIDHGYMDWMPEAETTFMPQESATRAVLTQAIYRLATAYEADKAAEAAATTEAAIEASTDAAIKTTDAAVNASTDAAIDTSKDTATDAAIDAAGDAVTEDDEFDNVIYGLLSLEASSEAIDLTGENTTEVWNSIADEPVVVPEVDAKSTATQETESADMPETPVFSDLTGEEDYIDAVYWAVDKGIIKGIDGAFCPDGVVDRQTVAVILARTMAALEIDLETDWGVIIDYDDLDEVSDWAIDGIAYCAMTGLMTGDETGCFCPRRSLNRAECAVILKRIDARLHQPAEDADDLIQTPEETTDLSQSSEAESDLNLAIEETIDRVVSSEEKSNLTQQSEEKSGTIQELE